MGAATKFLFDVDFAANDGKPERQAITLAEHALKLAEAETAAQRRGYEDARTDAGIEAERRMADALEHIAASLAQASDALKAIETRLECEAVEVAVAVARKLAPALDRMRAVRRNLRVGEQLLSRAHRLATHRRARQR